MNVLEELQKFYNEYDGQKGIIGFSSNGKPIYFFKVQYTEQPKIIFQYSIHAREYITTYIAIEQIKEYQLNGKVGCCYFLPMLNPDGVEICINGKDNYKANARGVDLNVNFDADWGKGVSNVFVKGEQNFVGEKPFSEKETVVIRDFTLLIKPDMTVSYHSKGEEIYFEYGQTGDRYFRDLRLANLVSKTIKYPIRSSVGSSGGYKDWCVEKLGIPALTIEACPDFLSHPIGKEFLYTAKSNFNLPSFLTENFYG